MVKVSFLRPNLYQIWFDLLWIKHLLLGRCICTCFYSSNACFLKIVDFTMLYDLDIFHPHFTQVFLTKGQSAIKFHASNTMPATAWSFYVIHSSSSHISQISSCDLWFYHLMTTNNTENHVDEHFINLYMFSNSASHCTHRHTFNSLTKSRFKPEHPYRYKPLLIFPPYRINSFTDITSYW